MVNNELIKFIIISLKYLILIKTIEDWNGRLDINVTNGILHSIYTIIPFKL